MTKVIIESGDTAALLCDEWPEAWIRTDTLVNVEDSR